MITEKYKIIRVAYYLPKTGAVHHEKIGPIPPSDVSSLVRDLVKKRNVMGLWVEDQL